MKKYATMQVQSSVLVPKGASRAQLRAIAIRHQFNFEPRPGYLYVRSRAISSRTNDNYDEFPAEEIKKSYRTFIGKPVFVNHVNDNHHRARGVVIDAALHEHRLADGSPDTWAEVLMEVDAIRFPKLAEAIRKGRIDRTSMGTDVEYSICSHCGNRASTPAEYCAHIPRLKGKKVLKRSAKTGQQEEHLIREVCYGLRFFENSLLVEPPADPTAFFTGVEDHSGLGKAASKTASEADDLEYQKALSDFEDLLREDNPHLPRGSVMNAVDQVVNEHGLHHAPGTFDRHVDDQLRGQATQKTASNTEPIALMLQHWDKVNLGIGHNQPYQRDEARAELQGLRDQGHTHVQHHDQPWLGKSFKPVHPSTGVMPIEHAIGDYAGRSRPQADDGAAPYNSESRAQVYEPRVRALIDLQNQGFTHARWGRDYEGDEVYTWHGAMPSDQPTKYSKQASWDGDEDERETTCGLCGNLKRADGSHPYNGVGPSDRCPNGSEPVDEKAERIYQSLNPADYCHDNCRDGHAEDLARGIGTHHIFNADEGQDASISAGPHEEPVSRQSGTYEYRNPGDQALCHYCRKPLVNTGMSSLGLLQHFAGEVVQLPGTKRTGSEPHLHNGDPDAPCKTCGWGSNLYHHNPDRVAYWHSDKRQEDEAKQAAEYDRQASNYYSMDPSTIRKMMNSGGSPEYCQHPAHRSDSENIYSGNPKATLATQIGRGGHPVCNEHADAFKHLPTPGEILAKDDQEKFRGVSSEDRYENRRADDRRSRMRVVQSLTEHFASDFSDAWSRIPTDPLDYSQCTSKKDNPTFCNWHKTDHMETDGEPRTDIDGHGNPMSSHTLKIPECDLCDGHHDTLHHYSEAEGNSGHREDESVLDDLWDGHEGPVHPGDKHFGKRRRHKGHHHHRTQRNHPMHTGRGWAPGWGMGWGVGHPGYCCEADSCVNDGDDGGDLGDDGGSVGDGGDGGGAEGVLTRFFVVASADEDELNEPCSGGQCDDYPDPHTWHEHFDRHKARGLDPWGNKVHQPYDGHSAWSCNNYDCPEHPSEMYDMYRPPSERKNPGWGNMSSGMPGWMKHDFQPTGEKEVGREIGRHFHEQGLTEDARYLLDQQRQGPTKYSTRRTANLLDRDHPDAVHLESHPGHPDSPTLCNRRGPQYKTHESPLNTTCEDCLHEWEGSHECEHPYCQENGFPDGWHTQAEHDYSPPAHLDPHSDESQDAKKHIQDALGEHPLSFLLEQNERDDGTNGPSKYSMLTRHFAAGTFGGPDEDRWIRCGQGHRHWGSAGAAGLLIRHTDDQGTHRYLLQHRAPHVDHGGTWGTLGGALHKDEDPIDGAIRESYEEVGNMPHGISHVHTHTDDHGGWAYHTIVMQSPGRFLPHAKDNETGKEGYGWFTHPEMKDIDLHPGFAKTVDKVLAPIEKKAEHIEINPDDYAMLQDHFRGQDSVRRQMREHAEKRTVNLADPVDLKQHMLEAHDFEPDDFWRNSHPSDHPALGPAGDDDRPLTHMEIHKLHDHDHEVGDYSGTTLGDSHFHTAVRKQATWIGDHPEEPTLFWRAPKTKQWEIHIHNHTPDRQLREEYGAKPSQDVTVYHADQMSPPHPANPEGRPRGGWTVEHDSNTGETRTPPNAWGTVMPRLPDHVHKQVQRALQTVKDNAANHADLYGQMAEHKDISDDLKMVPHRMEQEEKGKRMFRNLLNAAGERTCNHCDGEGGTERGPNTCGMCDGHGFLKESSLVKTADEDQCPYDGSDSLMVNGEYVCEEGHHWRPSDPAAQAFHGDGSQHGKLQGLAAVGDNPAKGLFRHEIKASEIQEGDFLDIGGRTRVSRVHPDQSKNIKFQTKTRGARSPSGQVHEPDAPLKVWRRTDGKISTRIFSSLRSFFASEEKVAGGYLNMISGDGEDRWAEPAGKAPYDPMESSLGLAPKEEGHGPWHITRHPETRAYQVVDNQNRLVDSYKDPGNPSYNLHDQNASQHAVHHWVKYNQDHGHIPKWHTPETKVSPHQTAEPNTEVEETGLSFGTHMGRGLKLPGTEHARRRGEPIEDGNSIDTQHIEFHAPAPPFAHSTEDPKIAEYKQRAKDNPAPQVYPPKVIQESSSPQHGTTYKTIQHGHPDYDKSGAFHDPSPSEEWHGPYHVIQHPETKKFHVVDNQNRVTNYGGRDGMDEQHHAEERRDYADGRQASKEKGRGLAEKIFGDSMEIMDLGGTQESRASERRTKNLSGLMHRYEGGDHHPLNPGKFGHDKDEDDEGDPYYEVKDPEGSGWKARDYGHSDITIHHEATGDDQHDRVQVAPTNHMNHDVPEKPEGFGHDELHTVLHNWAHGDPNPDPRYPDDIDEHTGKGYAVGHDYARNTPQVENWQKRKGYKP